MLLYNQLLEQLLRLDISFMLYKMYIRHYLLKEENLNIIYLEFHLFLEDQLNQISPYKAVKDK